MKEIVVPSFLKYGISSSLEESENQFSHILDREDYENKNSWEINYEEEKAHSTKNPTKFHFRYDQDRRIKKCYTC